MTCGAVKCSPQTITMYGNVTHCQMDAGPLPSHGDDDDDFDDFSMAWGSVDYLLELGFAGPLPPVVTDGGDDDALRFMEEPDVPGTEICERTKRKALPLTHMHPIAEGDEPLEGDEPPKRKRRFSAGLAACICKVQCLPGANTCARKCWRAIRKRAAPCLGRPAARTRWA